VLKGKIVGVVNGANTPMLKKLVDDLIPLEI